MNATTNTALVAISRHPYFKAIGHSNMNLKINANYCQNLLTSFGIKLFKKNTEED